MFSWKLGIVVALAFLIQGALSAVQMKHFSNEFMKLRRQGKVACGRKSGGFHAGAIVMFLIDEEGRVRTAKKLEGITVLARVKDLPGFEGKFVGSLTGEEVPKSHRNLRKAVADAALTYRKYTAGEEITDPPSPCQKAVSAVRTLSQRAGLAAK